MPRVTVLLASYNGARFIEEQIRSIAGQSVAELDLIVSDDGSTDGTLDIVRELGAGWSKGQFTLLDGPRAGNPADNFRHLFLNLPEDAPIVALSDQDDVWLPDKIERALADLSMVPAGVPAVACSRTRLIDEAGRPIGYSRYFTKPPSFRNAVVQSIAGGNTMILNEAAVAVVQESFRRGVHVPAHDWWIYMLITGVGGRMLYREQADTLYRQHGSNAVGDNQGWGARLVRFRKLLAGQFKDWNQTNLAALKTCRSLLASEAEEVLTRMEATKNLGVLRRVSAIRTLRIYRQTAAGQLMLYFSAAFSLL